jgi:hypothetical protein
MATRTDNESASDEPDVMRIAMLLPLPARTPAEAVEVYRALEAGL